MTESVGTPISPAPQPQKKNNTVLIVVIVLVLLCCCCAVGLVALYFGYDSLGDPLGIYGALPRLAAVLA